MSRLLLTVLGCLSLGFIVACGGGATSSVNAPRSKPATSSTPATAEEPGSIKDRISRLSKDEQRYVKCALTSIVPIMNPANMVVGDIGKLPGVEVFQVVDSSTVLARSNGELFFLSGVSTAGMVDGRKYSVDECFIVEGTRRYTTAIGSSKQVFSLKLISTAAADSIVQDEFKAQMERAQKVARAEVAEQRAAKEKEAADKAAEEQARKEADTVAKRRKWQSADGAFSVDAEFVSYGAGKVKLRRLDNQKEITIEAETLSPADLAWIKSRGAGK